MQKQTAPVFRQTEKELRNEDNYKDQKDNIEGTLQLTTKEKVCELIPGSRGAFVQALFQ